MSENSLDLDAIEARLLDARRAAEKRTVSRRAAEESLRTAILSAADVPALLAEVRNLRERIEKTHSIMEAMMPDAAVVLNEAAARIRARGAR